MTATTRKRVARPTWVALLIILGAVLWLKGAPQTIPPTTLPPISDETHEHRAPALAARSTTTPTVVPGELGAGEPPLTSHAGTPALVGMGTDREVFQVVVHAEDPMGNPIANVEVWLADQWRRGPELRSGTWPKQLTNVSGQAHFHVAAGTWFVHAWHEHFAPSAHSRHGNGAELRIAVPSRRVARVRLLPICVLCYQVTKDPPPLAHGCVGSGMGSLVMDMDPLWVSRQAAVKETIRYEFPDAHCSAYLFTGDRKRMGRWRALAVWSGRTPVIVPLQPVALAEFRQPQMVSPEGSVPSIAFGSVLLTADSATSEALRSARIRATRTLASRRVRPPHDPEDVLGQLYYDLALGDVTTLPTGTYELFVEGHPFITGLQNQGDMVIDLGSFVTRHLATKQPLHRVHLDFQLPPGALHRPFHGRLVQLPTRLGVALMAHLREEAKDWLLPEGQYAYEVRMATENVLATELFASGQFVAAAPPGGGALAIPVQFVERSTQTPTGR